MKKILITILALVYLTTSIGATMHMHYCMDKLVSWGLSKSANDKKSCPSCGIAKAKTDKHCVKETEGCCKDEYKHVKLDKDQKIAENFIHLAKSATEVITQVFSEYTFEYISSLTEEYPLTHAPPRTGNVALFVRNCVFRI